MIWDSQQPILEQEARGLLLQLLQGGKEAVS